MSKRGKWILRLTVIFLFMILGVLIGGSWIFNLVANEWSYYHKCNGKPLLEYVSNRYQIKFPSDIQNIRGAKTWTTWDGWSDFVLSFETTPKRSKEFIDMFPRPLQLRSFQNGEDVFHNISEVLPDWVPKNIHKGNIGETSLSPVNQAEVTYSISVVTETINENMCIVYLQGNFKGAGN